MGCTFKIHIGKIPISKEALDSDFRNVTDDDNKIYDLPTLDIGECSMLKASVTNDVEAFIPNPIRILSGLLPSAQSGCDCKIDDQLIKLVEVIEWTNSTGYDMYTTKGVLLKFLKKHLGKECFYICW